MKINPFIIIPVVILIFTAFHFGKQILPDGNIYESNKALKNLQIQNATSLNKLKTKLEELKDIDNPSEHNLWHINHTQKSITHLQRFAKPKYQSSLNFSRSTITPLTTIGVIIIIVFLYIWHYTKTKSKIRPAIGLSHASKRMNPQGDPVAENTHWQAMATGASNFKMQKMKQTTSGVMITSSFEVRLFYWAFIMMGLFPILTEYLFFFQDIDYILSPIFSAHGAFILIGVAIKGYFIKANISFNNTDQTIIQKKRFTPFKDVHALQVISSLAGGHGQGIYRNNELNLVLKNGHRINLLNHGDEEGFEHQLIQINNLLNVPVWQT